MALERAIPTRATGSVLRVGLAQIDCRLGDVEANLRHHLVWIEEARRRAIDLLVFPELSLTGYRLLHLTARVAQRPAESPAIAELAAAAGPMAVVVGLVEEDERGALRNSALLLQNGSPVRIHRKLYLPTYGLFQEERFFRAGRRLVLAEVGGARIGLLICEDLWHPSLAGRLAAAGAQLLVVVSAGPGRIGPGELPESQESWELVTRSTALFNTCWVVYCNRVGWEEGAFYAGGSHVVRPGGELDVRAPFLDEHLLIAEVDPRDALRLRMRLPVLEDERTDIEGPEAPW
jgi:predicted amidohydrolase